MSASSPVPTQAKPKCEDQAELTADEVAALWAIGDGITIWAQANAAVYRSIAAKRPDIIEISEPTGNMVGKQDEFGRTIQFSSNSTPASYRYVHARRAALLAPPRGPLAGPRPGDRVRLRPNLTWPGLEPRHPGTVEHNDGRGRLYVLWDAVDLGSCGISIWHEHVEPIPAEAAG